MNSAKALPTLVVAAALALGTAISLGLARFAYALLLPPMRADLGWSYLTAGAMNTVNAIGYLAGALVAPLFLRHVDARTVFLGGSLRHRRGTARPWPGRERRRALRDALRRRPGQCRRLHRRRPARRAPGRPPAAAPRQRTRQRRPRARHLLRRHRRSASSPRRCSCRVHRARGRRRMPGRAPGSRSARSRRSPPLVAALGDPPSLRRRAGAASARTVAAASAWRAFAAGAVAYLLFGIGYIGYMTFVISLLREEHFAAGLARSSSRCSAPRSSPRRGSGPRLLQRFRGGGAFALLSALRRRGDAAAGAQRAPLASCSPRGCCSAPSSCRSSPRPRHSCATTSPPADWPAASPPSRSSSRPARSSARAWSAWSPIASAACVPASPARPGAAAGGADRVAASARPCARATESLRGRGSRAVAPSSSASSRAKRRVADRRRRRSGSSSRSRPSRTVALPQPIDAVAPEQRQRVVAELALRRRRIGLEAIGPAPEQLEAAPVPDDRVERREQAHALVGRVARRARVLVGRPVPGRAVEAHARQRARARLPAPRAFRPPRCGAP